MNRILGAEHFTVYVHSVTTDVYRMLQRYVSEGLIEVVDWRIDTDRYVVEYYGQHTAIIDCLYRNMYATKYLIFNDADEVIIPRQEKNWKLMIAKKDKDTTGSFLVKNVFYCEPKNNQGAMEGFNYSLVPCNTMRIPSYYQRWFRQMHVFEYKVRSKLIVKPKTIDRLLVHSVRDHLPGFSTYKVPAEVALVQHYRDFNCYSEELQPDLRMLEYAPELTKAVGKYLC